MKNPSCFNKFDEKSEFCKEVCRCSVECSGNEIVRDEVEEVKFAYKRKILSMKDLCKYGMKAMGKRNLGK